MKIINKKSLIILLFLTYAFVGVNNVFGLTEIGSLVDRAGEVAKYNTDPKETSSTVAGRFIAVFLSLVGVIFISLTIYAGYLWMTARGDEEKVTRAKDILQNVIIGMVIVLSAYVITYFFSYVFSKNYIKNGGFE